MSLRMRVFPWTYRWWCVPIVAVVIAGGAGAAWGIERGEPAPRGSDRMDRRSLEMPLPDEYLDPQWPTAGDDPVIAPEESDSVQNVPLDAEQPDAAEKEEMERYKEALGATDKPDDFQQDSWGQSPRQDRAGEDGAHDPAQW